MTLIESAVATKIQSVRIQDSNNRYGNKEALASMEDGRLKFVFAWFDDELSFSPRDFIGLTIEEARDLKQKRDIAYLRS